MKYKKMFTLLFISVMMMAMVVGCNKSSSQAPASQSDIVGHPEKKFHTMLTGGTGGTYYPIGIIFLTLWNEKLVDMVINVFSQASAGPVENLNMLKSGEADLGIAVSFVMASFLGIPYVKIMVAGIIPALFYYFSIFCRVIPGTKTDLIGIIVVITIIAIRHFKKKNKHVKVDSGV